MARADLLLSLVKAATAGDRTLATKTVEAMAAEERAKKHLVLADQLEAQVRKTPSQPPELLRNSDQAVELFQEIAPTRELEDLVLDKTVLCLLREVISEQYRADLLRSYNLAPRHRLLLVGPPGNGKTSLAEALATALMVPLYRVRYDGLITSFLGETASKLRRLFELARSRKCVLFFDEFDTVGKERGDTHETGEIKRVVSSLLMMIDDLPSHVVVVCATNHPELLDRAVWRRFQLRIDLQAPTSSQIEEYITKAQSRSRLRFGLSPKSIAQKLEGANYSDLEAFVENVLRRYVLSLPNGDLPKLAREVLAESSSYPIKKARARSKPRRR